MKSVGVLIGIVAVLLGGLWLLQGIGVVNLRAILCFADCDPVQGSSATWVAIGLLVLTAGAAAALWCWKRRAA